MARFSSHSPDFPSSQRYLQLHPNHLQQSFVQNQGTGESELSSSTTKLRAAAHTCRRLHSIQAKPLHAQCHSFTGSSQLWDQISIKQLLIFFLNRLFCLKTKPATTTTATTRMKSSSSSTQEVSLARRERGGPLPGLWPLQCCRPVCRVLQPRDVCLKKG